MDIKVRVIGFGFFASFFSSVNCRFRRAGYIIRNKHTPMGMDIPANCRLLKARLNSGMTCERESPASMHKKTHRTRYFSKMPKWISVLSPKGYSPKKEGYLLFLCCLATHVGQPDAWQHSFSGIPYGHLSSLFMFLVTSLFLNYHNHINNFRYIYTFCFHKHI